MIANDTDRLSTDPAKRPNPLHDPTRQPAGTVPLHCTPCGAWIAWCCPPVPPCRVVCPDCRGG